MEIYLKRKLQKQLAGHLSQMVIYNQKRMISKNNYKKSTSMKMIKNNNNNYNNSNKMGMKRLTNLLWKFCRNFNRINLRKYKCYQKNQKIKK